MFGNARHKGEGILEKNKYHLKNARRKQNSRPTDVYYSIS